MDFIVLLETKLQKKYFWNYVVIYFQQSMTWSNFFVPHYKLFFCNICIWYLNLNKRFIPKLNINQNFPWIIIFMISISARPQIYKWILISANILVSICCRKEVKILDALLHKSMLLKNKEVCYRVQNLEHVLKN